MHSSRKNGFTKSHGLSMLLAALAVTGCGPVNIGSDKCSVASCSGLAQPESTQCADGTVAGVTGACVNVADGTCAWEVTTCSTACKAGATKPADDGCNTCTCTQSGTWECTLMACGDPTTCSESDCGEKPESMPYLCDDGTIGGFTGQCLRDASGACTWEIRTCPTAATCTPDECGPRPKCAQYTCEDGSIAGCTDNCYRDSNGKCGWEIRTCASVCTSETCQCLPGDPGYLDGRCPACTVGADQTCNDDSLMSSLAGTCVLQYCVCDEPFGINPENGKCKKQAPTAASVCTPNVNQTCNGNLEVSSYQGRCLFDGTCACIGNNVFDPTTGKCVIKR